MSDPLAGLRRVSTHPHAQDTILERAEVFTDGFAMSNAASSAVGDMRTAKDDTLNRRRYRAANR